MKKVINFMVVFMLALLYCSFKGAAQEYKLRQVVNMANSKMESTVYVKGKRQRTEALMPGMPINLAVIEQCDLRRTIKLNDNKKLYFIQRFDVAKDQPVKPSKEPLPAKEEKVVKKGGVITIWYNIIDTGERKKMFGFTARHIWTTQKMRPSADACGMRDSLLIKTDGWYIDLPQYECKRSGGTGGYGRGDGQPECEDKYVSHTSGKGKLGFPVVQKITTITGEGTNVVETSIETLEFSTAKLDTMLFTVPPGYQPVFKEEELYTQADMESMMQEAMKDNRTANVNKEEKAPGKIRIGVFAPTGNTDVQEKALQQQLVRTITDQGVEAIPVSSVEEARKYQCDYTLNSVFASIKSETTVGGVIKAIRKRAPNLAGAYNIQGNLTLLDVKDGTEKNRQVVDGKYEGNIDDAATKALEEACRRVVQNLK